MQTLPVLSSGGGLTWVGCYGPMSRWLETVNKGCALQDKYDISRSCYTRVMNEGHFVGSAVDAAFRQGRSGHGRNGSPSSVREQLDMVLEMGYIPYKTPLWAIRRSRNGPARTGSDSTGRSSRCWTRTTSSIRGGGARRGTRSDTVQEIMMSSRQRKGMALRVHPLRHLQGRAQHICARLPRRRALPGRVVFPFGPHVSGPRRVGGRTIPRRR